MPPTPRPLQISIDDSDVGRSCDNRSCREVLSDDDDEDMVDVGSLRSGSGGGSISSGRCDDDGDDGSISSYSGEEEGSDGDSDGDDSSSFSSSSSSSSWSSSHTSFSSAEDPPPRSSRKKNAAMAALATAATKAQANPGPDNIRDNPQQRLRQRSVNDVGLGAGVRPRSFPKDSPIVRPVDLNAGEAVGGAMLRRRGAAGGGHVDDDGDDDDDDCKHSRRREGRDDSSWPSKIERRRGCRGGSSSPPLPRRHERGVGVSDRTNGKTPSRPGRGRARAKKKKKEQRSLCRRLYGRYLCGRLSNAVLAIAFLAWIVAQALYYCEFSKYDTFGLLYEANGEDGIIDGAVGGSVADYDARPFEHPRLVNPAAMERLRRKREQEAELALGSAAGDGKRAASRKGGGKSGGKSGLNSKDRDSVEKVNKGCSELKWHNYDFPTCNGIHEIDMRIMAVPHISKIDQMEIQKREQNRNTNTTTEHQYHPHVKWGYVGKGLWRDVFSCDPNGETVGTPHPPPAVLKLMKAEHKYVTRNYHRHRRDALVMERLSSSPRIADMYGFCGNTVLTRSIGLTLEDVIYAKERERVKRWSPGGGGFHTSPPLDELVARDTNGELVATRETPLGRVKLALGVFHGLVDLHEGPSTHSASSGKDGGWLPVIHADLQAKQYLVDPHTGNVFVNDFNRCRFVTHRDSDGGSCPIRIPSAPGASRSPEEYDMNGLDEKMDVYSAGNVLYGILTGLRPWSGERGKKIKSAIQRGERPVLNGLRGNETTGAVDAELVRLLDRVYEHDPRRRASAREIVEALERLLERETTG